MENHAKLGAGVQADMPLWVPDGKGGWALWFDGVNHYMDPGKNGLPTGAKARAIEVLARSFSVSGGLAIIGYGTGSGNQAFILWIGQNSAGDIYIECWGGGWYTSGGIITTSREHHIIIGFDGTNPACYVDGASKSLSTAGAPAPATANTYFRIGEQFTGGIRQWNGILHYARIYTFVPSAGEALVLSRGGRLEVVT